MRVALEEETDDAEERAHVKEMYGDTRIDYNSFHPDKNQAKLRLAISDKLKDELKGVEGETLSPEGEMMMARLAEMQTRMMEELMTGEKRSAPTVAAEREATSGSVAMTDRGSISRARGNTLARRDSVFAELGA